MSEQQRLLIEDTKNLSDEMIKQIRKYIAELKFNSVINNAPKELIPENEDELMKMIEEGYENMEDAISLDEVVTKIDEMYTK